jgi:DNA-binding transcriptional LysR family regulator
MDLPQLRAFIAIADAGGVTRAAERLNLSQPAVSRQVQTLEAELGLALFTREGRRMRLTSEGEDLLRRSRLIIAEANALQERARALQSGETGILRIGTTPPMIEAVLSGFLRGYRTRHPGVDVHIVEDGGASLTTRLEEGDVHLAYVPADNSRFTGRLLYPIHVVAVVPKTSELARHPTLEISSIAEKPLLLLRRGFGSREWFDDACQAAGIRPAMLLESSSHNVVIGLARAGYGIGILPSAIAMPHKDLQVIPLVRKRASIGKWTMLAWDGNRLLPPYARRFAEELAHYARSHYPGREWVEKAPAIRKPSVPTD